MEFRLLYIPTFTMDGITGIKPVRESLVQLIQIDLKDLVQRNIQRSGCLGKIPCNVTQFAD